MISADSGDAGRDLFVPRDRQMPFDITGPPHIVRVFTRISALVLLGQIGYNKVKFVFFDNQECLLSDFSVVFGPNLFPELDQLPASWTRHVSCSFKYRHRPEATTAREIMQDPNAYLAALLDRLKVFFLIRIGCEQPFRIVEHLSTVRM